MTGEAGARKRPKACAGPTHVAVPSGGPSVRNVIVIISDTVRREYLGISGGRVRTPNLDSLGRESVRFERAMAASYPTVPARADWLTGHYAFPATGWGPLSRETPTVMELITAAGITTAGVVDTPFYMKTGFNLDRGFRHFYDIPGQQSLSGRRTELIPRVRETELDHCAPRTVTVAEQCLEQLREREPFLLWVDMWDPHEPWDAPTWYVDAYTDNYDGRVVWPPYCDYREAGMSDGDLEIAIASYCGKLAMVDRWIGRLLDGLETLRLADDTAVVFLSDHGFYFGERNGLLGKLRRRTNDDGTASWLRSPLYHEVIDVPLWIRQPGRSSRVDSRLVSAIDVAPTLLALFGLEAPETFHGRSLLPHLDAEGEPVRSVALSAMPLAEPGTPSPVVDDIMRTVLEWQPITVTTERWRLLFSRWSDPVELYDLSDDPAEMQNVASENPDVVRELHGMMVAELRRAGVDERDLEQRM